MSSGRAGAVLVGVFLTVYSVAAFAATPMTVRDEFNAASYNGSDGSHPWNGPWTEIGESDGPSSGDVRVRPGSCASGRCVRIEATAAQIGVRRNVDLSEAITATLTYRVASAGGAAGDLLVRVSSNSGASWSTIASHDTSPQLPATNTVDIAPWAGSGTAISFVAQLSSGRVTVDDITVNADLPDATTSTTAPPASTTTTTTPGTTTTTTLPGPTTTTTTLPGATTTTTSPVEQTGTTTTTVPGATTTTLPGATTSNLSPATTIVADGSIAAPASDAPPPAKHEGSGNKPVPSRPAGDAGSELAAESTADPQEIAAPPEPDEPTVPTTMLGVAAETLPLMSAQLVVLGLGVAVFLGSGKQR
jgi:hypothetical protein